MYLLQLKRATKMNPPPSTDYSNRNKSKGSKRGTHSECHLFFHLKKGRGLNGYK